MDILRFLHSGVRWLVLLVALVNLVYFALGWLQGRHYDWTARRLMSAFGGVISLQWLIGVIFLIVLGGQTGLGVLPLLGAPDGHDGRRIRSQCAQHPASP